MAASKKKEAKPVEISNTVFIPNEEIVVNQGQIKGLPKNPRFVKDDRFLALRKSIRDFPEMLSLRELIVFLCKGKYVVIAGNMRFRAGKEEGLDGFPCKVLSPSTSVEMLAEIAIKDNVSFGELDFDILANEWTEFNLNDWGMELPEFDGNFGGEEEEGGENSEDSDSEGEPDAEYPEGQLSDICQVQLYYNTQEAQELREIISRIQTHTGIGNFSDAVIAAMRSFDPIFQETMPKGVLGED